jgi:hypothetical protein
LFAQEKEFITEYFSNKWFNKIYLIWKLDGRMFMDLKIQYNNENKGELPLHSLPVYQLFCEQLGFQLEWDQQEKILHLASMLQGKKVYLMPMKENDNNTSMLESTNAFLKNTGITVISLPAESSIPEDGEIILKLTCCPNSNHDALSSKWIILHGQGPKAKKWAEYFGQEYRKSGFFAQVKEEEKKSSIATVELRCEQFPTSEENQQLEEKISFILASSILKGCTDNNPFLLFPHLSQESIKSLLSIEKKSTSLKPVLEKAKNRNNPLPNVENARENKQSTTTPVILPPFRLEVFFDYQVVFPNSKDDGFLIAGDMYLKNTGLGALINPHICMQVPIGANIQLKGQIVPPKMTDTIGIQSFTGDSAVGWRYVDENWREKVKEQGEYWICPIQALNIVPGETIKFPGFQFSIPKDSKGDIRIQGSVHFKDFNLEFPSANRIFLSFP